MATGLRYRVESVLGTVVLTTLAVAVANYPIVNGTATSVVPVFGRLPAEPLSNGALAIALATTLVVILGSLAPLFKPRPRRILDTILFAQKRVVVAGLALATIGYFDYTFRLPRATLVLAVGTLLVVLPPWFVHIRHRPAGEDARTVVVGDDAAAIRTVLEAVSAPVVGVVSPPLALETGSGTNPRPDGGVGTSEEDGTTNAAAGISRQDSGRSASASETADGAASGALLADVTHLGGLSRLSDVLVDREVSTAILAFAETDRAEFFGALEACYANGVTAKVHREQASSLLTTAVEGGEAIVELDLEPWDLQDRLIKRLFDVTFAWWGLVLLSPLLAVIAVAIKLDSPGPVLYGQQRTAEFGETFTVYKFRSMIPEAEAETGATISAEDAGGVDPRVTRVGRVLRQTHLDEIPQLWSILVGDMGVVGPRPERPELDRNIQRGVFQWRQRWFVKPGLTGLAQINDATGHEPETKLRYDVEYIRKQSFWFDLKIVVRQLWMVGLDAVGFLRPGGDGSDNE